ncbi:HAD family hydrolase [Dyella sp. LX-66]|uniref:D-glycero-alpha-D-manno-heptose-1,7-bisphosphate 7-phosphatase n=1 Tax=unclassified Dyella TaxID=2634549 RepID=UPI001BE0A0E2|nr:MULTISPECIES: HAD family hydrolase [unclassified Dyella]MBT2117219.1 HAD family hydrolase [Dyella sp. LX-1]MBT2138283.1 HAD family hydrolase [Dyella sp. LX-66]
MSVASAQGPRAFFDAHAVLASPVPRPALFLDRDGVINIDHGYVHLAEDTQWLPGIFELVRRARAAGYLCIVVSNQAGLARGYYSDEQFRAYTGWMHAQFAAQGAALDATYYCPHHPDAGLGELKQACACRKPQPGMFVAAREAFGIDMPASLMVGNQATDMQAALAAAVGHAYWLGGEQGTAARLGASVTSVASLDDILPGGMAARSG